MLKYHKCRRSKKITDTAYKIAASILIKLRSKLDLLAEELLRKETIEAESFVTLLGHKKAIVPVKA